MLEILQVSLLPKADDNAPTLSAVSLTTCAEERMIVILGDAQSRAKDLFLAIAGVGPRFSGSILWKGTELQSIRGMAPGKIQLIRPLPDSSGAESLHSFLLTLWRLHGNQHSDQKSDAGEKLVERILSHLNLSDKAHQQINTLSLDDQNRASICAALIPVPELVLWDASNQNLSLAEQGRVLASLKSTTDLGITAVMLAAEVSDLKLSDSIIALHRGTLVYHGGAEHLLHYFDIGCVSELKDRLATRADTQWAQSWEKHGTTFYEIRTADSREWLKTQSASTTLPSLLQPRQDSERVEFLVRVYARIRAEISKIIVGQEEVVEHLLIAILAGGHCLLEGVPGLAKTAIIRSLSQAMQLGFRRIQFTPDLMPADVTGTDILQEDPATGKRRLVFQKGPIFTQMLLADEINRTPAKTQAALLEAMQEHSVTAGGHTVSLQEPFFVLATQNPIEQEGTYPLPEAQKDRFLFQIRVGYPDMAAEKLIVERTTGDYDASIAPVVNGEQIIECQKAARRIPVPDHVMDFVVQLVRSTRPGSPEAPEFINELLSWGAGPRACQCLVSAAKVRAILRGRVHVNIEDIESLALPVLRHRIVPSFKAESEGVDVDQIIPRLLASIPRSPQHPSL